MLDLINVTSLILDVFGQIGEGRGKSFTMYDLIYFELSLFYSS